MSRGGRKAYVRHSMIQTKQKDLEKAFKMADADQTGSLSIEEYMKVFRDQGVNISREAALAFFRDKDKDMDGRISFEEFLGKVGKHIICKKFARQNSFHHYDSVYSGELTMQPC